MLCSIARLAHLWAAGGLIYEKDVFERLSLWIVNLASSYLYNRQMTTRRLYFDLHFDDNISGSYVEGIQRFWEGAEGGVAIVWFVKEIGGDKSKINAFGKEPADRGIEENDAGGLVGGKARVVMLCAEGNMPLVGR